MVWCCCESERDFTDSKLACARDPVVSSSDYGPRALGSNLPGCNYHFYCNYPLELT